MDATVKIADARSLRSEGQMFFFGEKSNLDFAFRPPKAAAYIHRAHLVSKNFEGRHPLIVLDQKIQVQLFSIVSKVVLI